MLVLEKLHGNRLTIRFTMASLPLCPLRQTTILSKHVTCAATNC